MKSWHLPHALYAGLIFEKRTTSVLATPKTMSHHGQNTGSVFISTSSMGIGGCVGIAVVYILFHKTSYVCILVMRSSPFHPLFSHSGHTVCNSREFRNLEITSVIVGVRPLMHDVGSTALRQF
jgi:hypothetical protein